MKFVIFFMAENVCDMTHNVYTLFGDIKNLFISLAEIGFLFGHHHRRRRHHLRSIRYVWTYGVYTWVVFYRSVFLLLVLFPRLEDS